MKQIISADTNSDLTNIGLLILRAGVASLMLTHGIPKLTMLLSGEPLKFPSVMGMSAGLSLGLAIFAEVICSILIFAGFATRLATIPLIITMLVAVFLIHAADPFAKQESGLQYLLAYTVLLIAGGGKYSLDYLLTARTNHVLR